MENPIQCFLVDDDLDDQEIFLMCLEKINDTIVCKVANDGEEAIKILLAKPEYTPHYIFLDVNMPKMNGIECLQQIKQIDRLTNSRVFMYSTTSEKKVVEKTKELGAEEFIVKPTKTMELTEKLSDIFTIYR